MGACTEVPPITTATANTFKANIKPEGEVVSWQEKDGFKQVRPMEVSWSGSQSSTGY